MARPVFAWAREHEPKLIRREHALRAVHGTSALGQFNMRIAVRIKEDGYYAGRYAGGGGVTGCCIDVPGTR